MVLRSLGCRHSAVVRWCWRRFVIEVYRDSPCRNSAAIARSDGAFHAVRRFKFPEVNTLCRTSTTLFSCSETAPLTAIWALVTPTIRTPGLDPNETNQSAVRCTAFDRFRSITAHDACYSQTRIPGIMFTDMNLQLFGAAGRRTGSRHHVRFSQAMRHTPRRCLRRRVMQTSRPSRVPCDTRWPGVPASAIRGIASALARPGDLFFAIRTSWLRRHKTFRIPFDRRACSGGSRLEQSWRVSSRHAASLLLKDIWLYALSHYRLFDNFLADAHTARFAELQCHRNHVYFTDCSRLHPNDEHPPPDVLYGEQLMPRLQCRRSSPSGKDPAHHHVRLTWVCTIRAPPKATPPMAGSPPVKFDFDTTACACPP